MLEGRRSVHLDDWISTEIALLKQFATEYRERRSVSPETARDMSMGRPCVVWKQEFQRWCAEKDAINTYSDDAP